MAKSRGGGVGGVADQGVKWEDTVLIITSNKFETIKRKNCGEEDG